MFFGLSRVNLSVKKFDLYWIEFRDLIDSWIFPVYQQHDPFLETGSSEDRFLEERRMHEVMTTFDYTNQVKWKTNLW